MTKITMSPKWNEKAESMVIFIHHFPDNMQHIIIKFNFPVHMEPGTSQHLQQSAISFLRGKGITATVNEEGMLEIN